MSNTKQRASMKMQKVDNYNSKNERHPHTDKHAQAMTMKQKHIATQKQNTNCTKHKQPTNELPVRFADQCPCSCSCPV